MLSDSVRVLTPAAEMGSVRVDMMKSPMGRWIRWELPSASTGIRNSVLYGGRWPLDKGRVPHTFAFFANVWAQRAHMPDGDHHEIPIDKLILSVSPGSIAENAIRARTWWFA